MSHAINFTGNAPLMDSNLNLANLVTDAFTLQCWIKSASSGPLFVAPSSHFALTLQPNGTILFSVKSQDRILSIQSKRVGLNDNGWHHVTAIKSDYELSLLINGKPVMAIPSPTDDPIITSGRGKGIFIGGNGKKGSPENFVGQMGNIGIWSVALTEQEAYQYFLEPPTVKKKGLISNHSFKRPALSRSLHLVGSSASEFVARDSLFVELTLTNNTDEDLTLVPSEETGKFPEGIPKTIAAHDAAEICLKSPADRPIAIDITYQNQIGTVTIDGQKSLDRYDSRVTAISKKNLVDEVSILENAESRLVATVLIATNMVLVNAENVRNFLSDVQSLNPDQIQVGGGDLSNVIAYNKARQIFNRRFQFNPFVIIYCESTEDVQLVYRNAKKNNLPIRVRSGGHDHEGECSGTDTILIDTTRINYVRYSTTTGRNPKTYAHIGAGQRFITLTTLLAENHVMIPHGTCATVGISGFTMGGGWGPWTRKYGMCCERLVGATIVLGNGNKKVLDATNDQDIPELLWALKGGGGMSYGLVTELVIETFPLPKTLIKFDVEWNGSGTKQTPTIQVLKAWETTIKSPDTPNLIGTNLKISAIPWDHNNYDDFDENKVVHNCIMYGYWQGNEKDLKAFLKRQFKTVKNYKFTIEGMGGNGKPYGQNLMSAWDRMSFYNVNRVANGLKPKPLPPDLDAPAPHKITSRLVDSSGLNQQGYKKFLESLTSSLIQKENQDYGLFTYVTLGAITGDFYQNISEGEKEKSAFPYPDKLYTIQYQCWWNTELSEKILGQDNPVYVNTNRALDWIEVCREFDIPRTSGAFISFKDSSIPTETYFAENYEDLKRIKETYSKDPDNHFRTRKTII